MQIVTGLNLPVRDFNTLKNRAVEQSENVSAVIRKLIQEADVETIKEHMQISKTTVMLDTETEARLEALAKALGHNQPGRVLRAIVETALHN